MLKLYSIPSHNLLPVLETFKVSSPIIFISISASVTIASEKIWAPLPMQAYDSGIIKGDIEM